MKISISKRKLESYRRAEIIARELRYQLSNRTEDNPNRLADMIIFWIKSTGEICYERPEKKFRKTKLVWIK